MAGGQLPHVDHPLGTLIVRGGAITVARGSPTTTTLEVIGGKVLHLPMPLRAEGVSS